MEIGIMQAGINIIQSLDLDIEATDCMKMNSHYFSHTVLTADIKDKVSLKKQLIWPPVFNHLLIS